VKRLRALLLHALTLWVLCAAVEGVARLLSSENVALAVSAATAPLLAAMVFSVYFGRFGPSSPVGTALGATAVVAALDMGRSLVLRGDLSAFQSPLATWLPLALVFAQVLASAIVARRRQPPSG